MNLQLAELMYCLPDISLPQSLSLDTVMSYLDKVFRLIKELFDIHWAIGSAVMLLAVGAVIFLLHLAAAALVAYLAFIH
ncbi:putative membrane protein [Desulfohalotomaculum tongense]|uniref:hypothetical protein n=1 Tax=Desulforadius tongensis TaxID=1216062 RepID=UPI001958E883|nr:hypothetical protein [Desulforadius tongensis]MBM7855776.1 putative membrane protein [Desulforadius tongensis]